VTKHVWPITKQGRRAWPYQATFVHELFLLFKMVVHPFFFKKLDDALPIGKSSSFMLLSMTPNSTVESS